MALSDFDEEIIKQRLKELRNGLRLEELVEQIIKTIGGEYSISKQSLSNFENPKISIKGMGIDRLDTLAKFYNVSIDYLLGRTDNKHEIVTASQNHYTISGSKLKRLIFFHPVTNQLNTSGVENNTALAYEYIRKGLIILASTIHQEALSQKSHTVKVQNAKLISILSERDKKARFLYKAKLPKNVEFKPVRAKDSKIGCIA